MIIHEYFPLEYIALDKELSSGYHPELNKILSSVGPDDIDMKLSHIASYCGIILDGTYTLDDRIKLAGILTKKLFLKRQRAESILIV